MANLQYIGARYVPKFYLNPDDSSNDWKSGVLYEALTIVTYNNDSYTSKIIVPDTVGNPADNPQYWACTTKYTAALVALQTTVGLHEARLDDIDEKLLFITTPEMYGAEGDGVADDTTAVQNALSAGKLCLMFQTYKTSSPIVLSSNNHVILDGTLHYVGADSAVIIRETPKFEGKGKVISDGAYAIRNDPSYKLYRAVVRGLNFVCKTVGYADSVMYLHTVGVGNITNNLFEHLNFEGGVDNNDFVANNGIYIHSEVSGYINENLFDQIRFDGCDFGIKIKCDGTWGSNRNEFKAVTTQNAAHSLYANSGSIRIMDNIFEFRTAELLTRTDNIQIDPKFIRNTFYGQYRPSMFKSIDSTPATGSYTGYTPHSNIIIGEMNYNDGNNTFINPTFLAFNDRVMFNIQTAYQSGVLGDTDPGTVTLDFSGAKNSVGFKIYRFATGATNQTIELNGYVNSYFSPIRFINITNNSGTDITITSLGTTLLSTTHLAKGLHELIYTSPTSIEVIY